MIILLYNKCKFSFACFHKEDKMNRPFSRRFMLCLVVVSMLLTSALWATPATVHAQDEGYAGDVPVELIDPASILGPDFSAAPGEGPSLPAEETPASGLTPDGRPVDSLAPQAVPPDQPELDSSQLGVLGADPGANAPWVRTPARMRLWISLAPTVLPIQASVLTTFPDQIILPHW